MPTSHKRCPVDYTCPLIDRAIELVEELVRVPEDAYEEEDNSGIILTITQQLESLRDINIELREWGEEEAARVDALEKKVAALTISNQRMAARLIGGDKDVC